MKKNPKFACIDSLAPHELQALFELMCSEIILKSPNQVKMEVIDLVGKNGELFKGKNATIADVMALVSLYDIQFELKLTYIPAEIKERPAPPVKESMGENVVAEAMTEQKKVVDFQAEEKSRQEDVNKVLDNKEEQLPDF